MHDFEFTIAVTEAHDNLKRDIRRLESYFL